jgi:uncharacterized protein
MTLAKQVQEKRAEILAVAAKYGAYHVRIFGSVARGEADSTSDVDFLVEMEANRLGVLLPQRVM